jgi:hypothetical protein
MGKDMASEVMKKNCLSNLGVFGVELKILRPRRIVIYSGGSTNKDKKYDDYLGPALFGENWRDDTGYDSSHQAQCGAKRLFWWSGSVVGGEFDGCRVP